MSIQTVNAEILAGNFTNEQLGSIIDAVKFARARLSEKNKRSITLGSNVNFTSTKTGQNYTGVVTKIAIKYVTVKTISGLWRVPANMLTVIADEREYA
jgi:exosome complex RNA-binding protein Csl4